MLEKGHEVTVITSDDARFRDYDSIFFPSASIIRVPPIGRIKGAVLYFRPLMLKNLFVERFDVVHAFTFFTFSSLLGVIVDGNIKISRSEIGPPNGLTFTKAGRKFSVYSLLIKVYKDLYDYITVYNRIEAESLLELGFDERKIVVISPMIDYHKFSRLAKSGLRSEGEIILGSISRISPEKGIHRLIPLVRSIKRCGIKKFRLLLAGRVDDPSYGYRVLQMLQNQLEDRFVYLGEVASPYKFYRMVDVVIVPSLIETGAISVLEAMAARKVVIASNIYPINLYIDHAANGFLFTEISEAVDFIESILEGNVSTEEIGKKAQNSVRQYDYRLVCSRLEHIYKPELKLKRNCE
ncbi:MAG: glycosyltransferase family 4 protein [Thermoproteota archaeon]